MFDRYRGGGGGGGGADNSITQMAVMDVSVDDLDRGGEWDDLFVPG